MPDVVVSPRNPDPSAYVPGAPEEGSPAATGQIAALAPAGRRSGARAAYVEFVRRLIDEDEDKLIEMFAPTVGFVNRPQTIPRAEIARRLRAQVDRSRAGELRIDSVIDPHDIRVREVDATTPRSAAVQVGDLIVTGAPRLRSQPSPFGVWEDTASLPLVFRWEAGQYVIVALEF